MIGWLYKLSFIKGKNETSINREKSAAKQLIVHGCLVITHKTVYMLVVKLKDSSLLAS